MGRLQHCDFWYTTQCWGAWLLTIWATDAQKRFWQFFNIQVARICSFGCCAKCASKILATSATISSWGAVGSYKICTRVYNCSPYKHSWEKHLPHYTWLGWLCISIKNYQKESTMLLIIPAFPLIPLGPLGLTGLCARSLPFHHYRGSWCLSNSNWKGWLEHTTNKALQT